MQHTIEIRTFCVPSLHVSGTHARGDPSPKLEQICIVGRSLTIRPSPFNDPPRVQAGKKN